MITMLAFASAPFFYPRPFLVPPTCRFGGVSLSCHTLRFLTGVADFVQDPHHVRRMVTHTESLFDYLSDTTGSPQVRREARFLCPLVQDFRQLATLLVRHPARSTRWLPGSQRFVTLFLVRLLPPLHRPRRYVQTVRNFLYRLSIFQEFYG
jgi:hypothetical protein